MHTSVAFRRVSIRELLWLAAVVLLPLACNPWSYDAFALPKAVLLRTLALLWLASFAAEGLAEHHWDVGPARGLFLAVGSFAAALLAATLASINPRVSLWIKRSRAASPAARVCSAPDSGAAWAAMKSIFR